MGVEEVVGDLAQAQFGQVYEFAQGFDEDVVVEHAAWYWDYDAASFVAGSESGTAISSISSSSNSRASSCRAG